MPTRTGSQTNCQVSVPQYVHLCVHTFLSYASTWPTLCYTVCTWLNPPFPVLKAGHPVCILIFIFYCYSIFIWNYNLMSVCVCMWFSKPFWLPVGVCIYTILCILVQLIHVHVHNSILLLSPFFRLAVSSFTISLFFFNAVCYTHIFQQIFIVYPVNNSPLACVLLHLLTCGTLCTLFPSVYTV